MNLNSDCNSNLSIPSEYKSNGELRSRVNTKAGSNLVSEDDGGSEHELQLESVYNGVEQTIN